MNTPSKSNLLFTFADMSVKDRAAKQVMKYFSRAGANVVSQDVSTQVKRTSGISFREMKLTFADSQTVLFRVKQSGDIYQVLLNGKLTPIKHQDDHIAAVGELVQMLDAGRTKFQAKLAKALVKLPPAIKTAAPKMLAVLTEKRDGLKEAIAAVREEIVAIKAPLTNNSSNNLTESNNESTISPEVNQTTEGVEMKKWRDLKESGATNEEITAKMKEDGLDIPQRSAIWNEIAPKTPKATKIPPKQKSSVEKVTAKHDLSGIPRILDADKRAKGTTGSMGAKLSNKELEFFNDIAGKSQLTEKQVSYLRSIGQKFNEHFYDVKILKPKPKRSSVGKISFEEYVEEFLDQHLALMGEKEKAEAYESYLKL